jgi:hypothetical protein
VTEIRILDDGESGGEHMARLFDGRWKCAGEQLWGIECEREWTDNGQRIWLLAALSGLIFICELS